MSINLVLSTCPVGYKNPYLEKLPDTKKGKLLKTVITLKENPPACPRLPAPGLYALYKALKKSHELFIALIIQLLPR